MLKLLSKTHIDFEGKRHLWMTISGILILAGLVNIVLQGGLTYSIDFTGGLSVTLRTYAPAGKPPLEEDAIRATLDRAGLKDSEVKTGRSEQGEDLLIKIKSESKFKTPEALIRSKLNESFPDKWHVVPDDQLDPAGLDDLRNVSFVAVSTDLSADQLKGVLGAVDMDSPQVIPHKTEQGKEVWLLAGEGRDAASRMRKALVVEYPGYKFELRSIDMVGPRIGSELRNQAILAAVASWGLIILYLWWRYDLVFGIAAIIALIHDTLITLAFLEFFRYEISMTVISAILTLIGFSTNDTIVVFDRIRENIRRSKDKSLKEVINDSINQTLSRTIITSGTVFLVVAVLYFMGGEVLRGFSFTMLIGVIVGTYSSIYIASPILIDYVEKTGHQFTKTMKAK